jgi:hypothetical protein
MLKRRLLLFERVLLSLFGGVITRFGLFFLILLTTRRGSEADIIEVNPFAWLLFGVTSFGIACRPTGKPKWLLCHRCSYFFNPDLYDPAVE